MTDLFPRIEGMAQRREDHRGYLEVLYESDACVLKRSLSRKGVFRGLHWQKPPHGQTKIFRVLSGTIADFIVDMDAPDRLLHHRIITPEDGWVRIDARYAHGFYAIEESLFEYFCDGGYAEEAELAFAITDDIRERLGVTDVILSDKDSRSAPLAIDKA